MAVKKNIYIYKIAPRQWENNKENKREINSFTIIQSLKIRPKNLIFLFLIAYKSHVLN